MLTETKKTNFDKHKGNTIYCGSSNEVKLEKTTRIWALKDR